MKLYGPQSAPLLALFVAAVVVVAMLKMAGCLPLDQGAPLPI